ncbi:acyl-coenzyme A synthetase/AMP-(fatty) acid ligase [Bradyrhizobium sp. GM6.1]
MFDLMNRYNPSIFYGVPTLFAAMLNDEAMKSERGGKSLRICTSAGEALPESVGNSWRARFGVDILDGVGSTELLHIFLSNAPGDIKYGSSGKPVPGYAVRLVNEAGQDVADGEVGELLVDAPSAGEGYWNQRHKSRRTFEGPWTRTGDKYVQGFRGPLYLLRPRRRHVQGLWHLGLALRGRERADHASRRAGSCRRARSRSGRSAEAQGLRRAAPRRDDGGPAGDA